MRNFALAACMFLAGQTARAEPALWRVDSPTAHVYLFGTMHILPKKAVWLSPGIVSALNASDSLWEEADIGIGNPQLASQIMAQAIAPDFDLWSALPPPYATKFHAELHACGLDPSMVAHVKPWMASMMATICQMMATSSSPLGAAADNPEAALLSRAEAAGKHVDYFETAQQQIGYMAGASPAAQLAELRQAIDEADSGHNDFSSLEDAWLNGDMAKISASVTATRHQNETFYQTIFVQRNERFAQRIVDILHGHGTTFVAVGAGHFAGSDSVLRFLADHGFNATRR